MTALTRFVNQKEDPSNKLIPRIPFQEKLLSKTEKNYKNYR